MRELEEDIHEIISGYVLANKKIVDQEKLLFGVLRKKQGRNKIIDKKGRESWQKMNREFCIEILER